MSIVDNISNLSHPNIQKYSHCLRQNEYFGVQWSKNYFGSSEAPLTPMNYRKKVLRFGMQMHLASFSTPWDLTIETKAILDRFMAFNGDITVQSTSICTRIIPDKVSNLLNREFKNLLTRFSQLFLLLIIQVSYCRIRQSNLICN
jgi:hypothetical protein